MVTLNSWEYPVDFVVLSLKATMGGYPIILGRPCLVIADAYIACHSRKMIISNGVNAKHMILYSLAQPLLQDDQIIWLDLDDTELEVNSIH